MDHRQNIEIKARIRDVEDIRRRVAAASASAGHVLRQTDTFFSCPTGRLKLREENDDKTELIYYQRPDQPGPKPCNFIIHPTLRAGNLKTVLEQACGCCGIVRKTRILYLIGQTRIHIDSVDGLGHFLELEVVLTPDQSHADGEEIARDLMNRLDIRDCDLIDRAYIDLLNACTPLPYQ